MEHRKVRINVDCSEDEFMYIKMLAAEEKKTISEFLLSLARNQMPKGRIPNQETQRVLRETEERKNLETHESLEDFWSAMGIDPNANS